MKIALFLTTKILNFKLPNVISGNFSFDEKEDKASKLINVKAENNNWILYSTEDVQIYQNNTYVEEIPITENQFYVLVRDKKQYLIHTTKITYSNPLTYTYTDNSSIIIGNKNTNNIEYNCPYLKELGVKIDFTNNTINLTKTGSSNIYLNSQVIEGNTASINYGDELNIYGLNIIFLNKLLLINNLSNIKVNTNQNLQNFILPPDDEPQSVDIKDLDLYSEDDYYSKSPRIRRIISTKEFKLSDPPKEGNSAELPFILVVGPMLTMGITSFTMFANTLIRLDNGETTFQKSWTQIVTSSVMLVSTLLWPLITNFYNRHQKAKLKKEIKVKYTKYLNEKRKELEKEREQQKIILIENLITLEDCLGIINNQSINFWDKRIDQSDFLVVRLGVGRVPLDATIAYPEEGFTIEESELKKASDALVAEFEYIESVPLGYSLYENKITAIMGTTTKSIYFTQNLLLQLITFYSYEDLKIVLFTEASRTHFWTFLRYLNHNFTNEKDFRFFSTTKENCKEVNEYLNMIINMRKESNAKPPHKPHYLIIIDGWDNIYQNDIIKEFTELEDDLGFSILIIENRMGKLPSKCNNFIYLEGVSSKVLKNSYDEQEQMFFNEEIHYNIPMLALSKRLANIPIEFADGLKELPNAISFLEMEKVGLVDQLNILNRWNSNDSTSSLRAEVGVDERGDLMYLDLHEKYHGPHGLIAGMTGSGKSEFIITYILSMAINYSPDDIAFILIDYKGGGLAFAFENKTNNIILPHLAGTITNLDKAEMDRTLVSIDSEIKRRQTIFNEARDMLGESTIDIYKYQMYFKEGKLNEPIPHLFIICDEFAELKSQQPDFMDNLISVARIGRSLGVHLILATQKPSGVVNDQIWSNTKFRVCLKVQDASDSKEMLKRPEAASLKQTGRFYLQVGYDEYFALGQSGWCGAKYYPSDKIIKQVDKSLNYINDCGQIIKSIQASNNIKIEAQGEQLAAIMNSIIKTAEITNKKARRLWLENIPEIILEEDLRTKYQVTNTPYQVKAIIGEYDAPEKQEQGLVTYNVLNDGNTLIYGNDSEERESILNAIIYSTCKSHTAEEINYYIIDYGSESLRKYKPLLHVGGIVFAGEDEKFYNLLKLISEDLQKRKKLFADFGGSYENYLKSSGHKIPLKVVIVNNYDSLAENYPDLYETLPELVRDSERFGIIFIFTATAINSIPSKVTQSCKNIYAFKLKDSSDYSSVFNVRSKVTPRDILGRGILNNDGLHEFQVCRIKNTEEETNDYLTKFLQEQNKTSNQKAKIIPTLPEIVRLNDIKEEIKSLNHLPVGISKKGLEIMTVDYSMNIGNLITSNKLANTEKFIKSLLYLFHFIPNTNLIVIDVLNLLKLDKIKYPNYYTENIDIIIDQIHDYLKKLLEIKSEARGIILIYGLTKFIDKLSDKNKLIELIKTLKSYEKFAFIVVDDAAKIKTFVFETWFTSIFSINDGIWVGRGLSDQNLLKVSTMSKEMTYDYKNDMGFLVSENQATLCRFIDFISEEGEDNEK